MIDFNKITNNELDNLDMSVLSKLINSVEYQGYYLAPSGSEHYRLLTYISLYNNGINLLDIGTYKGSSALALSTNKMNKVYSFNIVNNYDLNDENGIVFKIGYINTNESIDLVLSCPYILLDTMHDGWFENIFYQYLIDINYKGCLILDDIKLNQEMVMFWNSINNEKYDVSHLGHATGTGIIYFK